MNLNTLYLILAILFIGVGYAIYQITTIKQYLTLVDDALETCDKQSSTFQKHIKALSDRFGEYEKHISTLSTLIKSLQAEHHSIKEKTIMLEERWVIVADERITSIPKSNKEWYEAQQIVAQPVQKRWKAPKNSQTKTSLLSTNHASDDDDDGVNQDFAHIKDADFERILNSQKHENYNYPSKNKPNA